MRSALAKRFSAWRQSPVHFYPDQSKHTVAEICYNAAMHQSFVYILFSRPRGALYVGVTSDLKRRVYEHRHEVYAAGFTARYNIHKLGYYEVFSDIRQAIAREKQLKAGRREQKIRLIEGMNPQWRDLSETW